MALLEIGSVKTGPIRPDAVTFDCNEGAGHTGRWGDGSLPFEDGTFDEVYTSHTLEHVPWFKTMAALQEALRVLKPGGLIEVWVPDFGYIAQCYMDRKCGDKWRKYNPHSNPMIWANGRIFTYGPDEANWHRAVFDEDYLKECLTKAGFQGAARILKRTRGVSHGPIDLGMSARRPA